MTIYIVSNEDECLDTLEDLSRRGYEWRNGDSLDPAHVNRTMEDIWMQDYKVYLHEVTEQKYVLYGPADRAWAYAKEMPYEEEVVVVKEALDGERIRW